MNPYPAETHIPHSFDSFCKKVLKYEARNHQNHMKRRRDRESSFSELAAQEHGALAAMDKYPSEDFVFCVLGHDIIITDERIAEAITALTDEKRDIILLSYFLDMTDAAIGERMNLVRRTVHYKRKCSLKELKKLLEGYREQVAAESVSRAKDAYSENIFKGKVFCAHCGKPLHRQRNTRRTGPDVYYLHCIANSRIAKGTCPGVMMDEREVKMELAQYLRYQAVTPCGESLMKRQDDILAKERGGAVAAQVGRLRQEIGDKQRFLGGLYESLVDGILTRSEYFAMKGDYEEQITAAMTEITSLEAGLKDFQAEASARAGWADGIRQLHAGEAMNADLMNRLVDRIEIRRDKTLLVTCRSEAWGDVGHE